MIARGYTDYNAVKERVEAVLADIPQSTNL
jgi:hypothetical protein